jgi:NNP family nitrate/nitrite transporter-like MFS transporter
MGYVYGHTDSYGIGLALLSVTAALTLLLTVTIVRRTANQKRTEHSISEATA